MKVLLDMLEVATNKTQSLQKLEDVFGINVVDVVLPKGY